MDEDLERRIGSDELTEDAWRLSLPVGVTRQFDRFAVTGMVGYDVGFNEAEDGAFAGVLASYQLTESFLLGAELAADAPVDDFAERELRGNFSFIWDASDRLQVYGLVGQVLDHPAGEDGTLARLALHAAF